MVEITDRKSAEAWFSSQDRSAGEALATRAALRVAPALVGADPDQRERLALTAQRAMLISGVAAVGPTPEIMVEDLRSADSAALSADSAALSAALSALSAALSAARSAALSADSAALSALSAALSAASAARSADSAAYSALAMDAAAWAGHAGEAFARGPIWPDDLQPTALAKREATWLRLLAADPIWDFWHRWYLSMRDGTPLDWDLQRAVALIPNDDWDKGAAHIAEIIRGIEEAFWAERLPQHEVMEQSEKTGRFSVRPEAFDGAAAVESWLNQIDFAVTLAAESNTSDFSRMCTGFKYIAHTLENCRDDPNAIEQQLGAARGIIERNIARDDYEADDSLHALADVLKQIQLQMRADHPEVRDAWEKRIAQTLREVDGETRIAAAEAIRAETPRTEGRLTTEMDLDAETVETSDSPDAQAIAIRRAGGRAAKMNVLERSGKLAKDIDGSAGYKAVRIGTTGYTVGDLIWMLTNLF